MAQTAQPRRSYLGVPEGPHEYLQASQAPKVTEEVPLSGPPP